MTWFEAKEFVKDRDGEIYVLVQINFRDKSEELDTAPMTTFDKLRVDCIVVDQGMVTFLLEKPIEV